MKLGQVGWHVVQSANGWETSRIFGAECLLRSGGGDEFGPALDATPDGGRVAADAPTPSPDGGALLAALGAEYTLDHPLETSEERMGRHSAVRGVAVRMGCYVELEAAIDAALAAQEGGE